MIDTHGTPSKDIDEIEINESIDQIFRPDFRVYTQKHASTTNSDEIIGKTIKNSSFETQAFVQNMFGVYPLASLMPLDPMLTTYSVPT